VLSVPPPTPVQVAALVEVVEAGLRFAAWALNGAVLRDAVHTLTWLVSVYGRQAYTGAGPFLSTGQVAEVIGVSERAVRRRAEAGAYPGAYKPHDRWLIPASAISSVEVPSLGRGDRVGRALTRALDTAGAGSGQDRAVVADRWAWVRGCAFLVRRAARAGAREMGS